MRRRRRKRRRLLLPPPPPGLSPSRFRQADASQVSRAAGGDAFPQARSHLGHSRHGRSTPGLPHRVVVRMKWRDREEGALLRDPGKEDGGGGGGVCMYTHMALLPTPL